MPFPRCLWWHSIGWVSALRHAKRHAERLPTWSGPARVGSLTPVLADGYNVKTGELGLLAIDVDVPQQLGIETACRLGGIGTIRKNDVSSEAKADLFVIYLFWF